MNDCRKVIIDLSQPQLIPERIKRYAFESFDAAQKYPAADAKMQRLHVMLRIAEGILSKKASSPDHDPEGYFRETRANDDHKQGLIALNGGEKDWWKKRRKGMYASTDGKEDFVMRYSRFPYPYFLTYYFDNNLTVPPGVALRNLVREQDAEIADFDFSLDLGSWKDFISQGVQEKDEKFYSYSNDWEWGPIDTDENRWSFQMFNHDLLRDYHDRYTMRPVFLVESLGAADELEIEMKNRYAEHLRAELERTTGLQWKAQRTDYRKTPAAGDAIVAAAVGGYSIPECSDWSLFENRDVYVFKFGEPRIDVCLQDLLRVSAGIARDTRDELGKRIKYIIMPEKSGNEVKNSDIKYWTLAELFAEAQLHDCPIPPELENEYDLYRRKNSPIRTNPYVIEPFLRRRSWALLTGEEGTGKSFLAMALSSAIATGGKLFGNWKIRQRKATVLYIADCEMTDEIIRERMTIFKKLYPGCHNNLIIEPVKNMNLLEDGMEKIEKRLLRENASGRTVEILVLDHLLKLTGTHGDEDENWPRIRDWLERLNERGVTVLLLHHEYAGQRMLGTRLIAADAPARVHLDIVNHAGKDEIQFSVSIVKNRGGILQRNPMRVYLHLGKPPKWMLTEAKSADSEVDQKSDFRHMSADERKSKIVELRKAGKTNKEVAECLQCSESSVEKIVSTLPKELKKRINQKI